MTLLRPVITSDDFDRFIALPENDDKRFELFEGEITEVTSNSLSSIIAMLLGSFITAFVVQNDLGWVTGADGGYIVNGHRFSPDVGFISKVRHPQRPTVTYIPFAPDLAVEVVSPSDNERRLTRKVTTYLLAGSTVWVAYPDDEEVAVFAPGQPVIEVKRDGTLDGGGVLPGFTLALREIFRDDEPEITT
jgi:Uma2 family endonuclease